MSFRGIFLCFRGVYKMSIFEEFAEKWPSLFVARGEIEEFTEGMYKASTLNTFDAKGDGVSPRYRMGRRVFYRVSDLVAWGNGRKKGKNGENNV